MGGITQTYEPLRPIYAPGDMVAYYYTEQPRRYHAYYTKAASWQPEFTLACNESVWMVPGTVEV